MPSIYNLQEFDPSKIVSGEIDPKKVVPIKYQELPTNSAGMIIVDKNSDLTYLRKLSSLYTTKTKQSKFESVVDTEFTELEPVPQITVTVGGVNVSELNVIDTVINTSDSTTAAGPGLIL
jgi:hypothetical protein